MITKLTGEIARVDLDALNLAVDAFEYQVLIPEFVRRQLQGQLGDRVSLYTLQYLEGNPNQGRLVPRLIGFLSEVEREFFELFCSVDGVGVRKALRAMVHETEESRLGACQLGHDTGKGEDSRSMLGGGAPFHELPQVATAPRDPEIDKPAMDAAHRAERAEEEAHQLKRDLESARREVLEQRRRRDRDTDRGSWPVFLLDDAFRIRI